MSKTRSGATTTPTDAEWLRTDGRGGYACGTVSDLARRRYHGLWIARAAESARRHCIVAGVDERIAVGTEVVSLLHAHWAGMAGPVPPPVAVRFTARPYPTFHFRHGAFAIERAVQLVRAENGAAPCLLLRWRNLDDRPVRLSVRPLLGWCDADHLIRAHDGFDGTVTPRGASWGVRPDDSLPPLWMAADGVASFEAAPDWYRGFVYDFDRDRGYDHQGDRWSPGVLELDLQSNGTVTVAFSLEDPCDDPAQEWHRAAERAVREQAVIEAADPEKPAGLLRARLERAADDFLYRAPGDRLGVLAGFPWFGEWGRDVFIALPGLSLARGRFDLAEEVLNGALPFLRRGLLPNIYGATRDDSHFGSCDAALWFSLAVQRFADAGGDASLVRDSYVPALVSIADAYIAGTDLGLAVSDEGLLEAGGPNLNATWMDAQTASGPVTPREGLPVEIQALWYSLLAFLVERGVERGPSAETGRFEAAKLACGRAFKRMFWLPDGKYLADRVHSGEPDQAVRPNMLVAAALERSPLSRPQRAGVVRVAEAELLTACGLRTLSPRDPAYRPRYGGNIEARDGAYHQGTVWPWPAGFYVEAALRAATATERTKVCARLASWLQGFAHELDRAGLEHVSEVFDGDPPHRPGGTFAQAWNTGELLRALTLVGEAAS